MDNLSIRSIEFNKGCRFQVILMHTSWAYIISQLLILGSIQVIQVQVIHLFPQVTCPLPHLQTHQGGLKSTCKTYKLCASARDASLERQHQQATNKQTLQILKQARVLILKYLFPFSFVNGCKQL